MNKTKLSPEELETLANRIEKGWVPQNELRAVLEMLVPELRVLATYRQNHERKT